MKLTGREDNDDAGLEYVGHERPDEVHVSARMS